LTGDTFVVCFFDPYVRRGDVRTIPATEIFPFVKSASIFCLSPHTQLTLTSAIHSLLKVCSAFLTNPQLSAWCCAIISGLCGNHPAAEGIIRTLPNLLDIKRDLEVILASSDSCIVCAAVAAHVALFSMGIAFPSSLRAAVHFLATESPFCLMTRLAADSILDLTKKTKLSREELTTVLTAALKATGVRAVAIYHMVTELKEYHRAIAKTVKATTFLERLFGSIIDQECDFVGPIACHFLLVLSDNEENLFDGLQKTPVFEKLLGNLKRASSDQCESLVVLFRMMLAGGELKRTDLEQLAGFEDLIFTILLRNIETGNAFQSVALFQIVTYGSKYLQDWLLRMKRIVIDSQFPALVVGLLFQSQNRHAISDGILALRYLLGCKEPDIFEVFVSSFLLISTQTRQEKDEFDAKSATKLQEMEAQILQANKKIRDQDAELMALKTVNATLNHKCEKQTADETARGITEARIVKLKSIVRELKSDNSTFTATMESQNAVIQELHQKNRVLTERLTALSKLSEEMEKIYFC
jgi:hypothetical protein